MTVDVTELEVPTTITLTVDPDPPVEGNEATFTAYVEAEGDIAPGAGDGGVELLVDGVSIGVVPLTDTATTAHLAHDLTPGTHTVEARYLP